MVEKKPQRTCIGCRQKFEKSQLLRFVCQKDQLEIDPNFRKPGRGAYVCRSAECIESAFKKSQNVNRRLRVNLSTEIATHFKRFLLESI